MLDRLLKALSRKDDTPVEGGFSYCEYGSPGALSPWHVRVVKADETELKTGGGLHGQTLCEQPLTGFAWDVSEKQKTREEILARVARMSVSNHGYGGPRVCSGCAEALAALSPVKAMVLPHT